MTRLARQIALGVAESRSLAANFGYHPEVKDHAAPVPTIENLRGAACTCSSLAHRAPDPLPHHGCSAGIVVANIAYGLRPIGQDTCPVGPGCKPRTGTFTAGSGIFPAEIVHRDEQPGGGDERVAAALHRAGAGMGGL